MTVNERLPGQYCFVSFAWLTFYTGFIFIVYTTFGLSMFELVKKISNITPNARNMHSALALFFPFIWYPFAVSTKLI